MRNLLKSAAAVAGLAYAGPRRHKDRCEPAADRRRRCSGNLCGPRGVIAGEELNATGGIKGTPVKLIIEDNKSNPVEAAAA